MLHKTGLHDLFGLPYSSEGAPPATAVCTCGASVDVNHVCFHSLCRWFELLLLIKGALYCVVWHLLPPLPTFWQTFCQHCGAQVDLQKYQPRYAWFKVRHYALALAHLECSR